MIVGVGLDIIEIARFNRAGNPRFDERVFTAREMIYLQGRGPQAKAGLFAAKEAAVKALGTGFRGFWPCEVEILHDELGRPYLRLHRKAAEVAKRKNVSYISISITHHQTAAAAVAVAERDERRARRYKRCYARD